MTEQYVNPLSERYASKEMLHIFSANNKFSTWRKLWVALAVAQKNWSSCHGRANRTK